MLLKLARVDFSSLQLENLTNTHVLNTFLLNESEQIHE